MGAVEAEATLADGARAHLERLAQATASLARSPRRILFQLEFHGGYCIRGASVNIRGPAPGPGRGFRVAV